MSFPWYAIYADGEQQPRSLTQLVDVDQLAAAGLKAELIGDSLCQYGFDWAPADMVHKYHPRTKPKASLASWQLLTIFGPIVWGLITRSDHDEDRFAVELFRRAPVINMNGALEQSVIRGLEQRGHLAPGGADQIINMELP
ncbi:MAG: hypothetical protein V4508_02265 [Pseudomonadota bacterium]